MRPTTGSLPWKQLELEVETRVDPAWLAAAVNAVQHRLSAGERLTMYAYTTQSYSDVQNLLHGGTQYKSLAFPAKAVWSRNSDGILAVWNAKWVQLTDEV